MNYEGKKVRRLEGLSRLRRFLVILPRGVNACCHRDSAELRWIQATMLGYKQDGVALDANMHLKHLHLTHSSICGSGAVALSVLMWRAMTLR